MDGLLDAFFTQGKRASAKTVAVYKYQLGKNIRPALGAMQARKLTTPHLSEYRTQRLAEGAQDSTVNRETSVLRAAYNWGRRQTPPLVTNVPYFPMVSEANRARQGFLKPEDYAKLRDALPAYLKPLFITANAVGGRMQELLDVQWEWVDFEREEILIPRQITKNKTARVLPFLTQEMTDALRAAKSERDALWQQCPWVFSHNGQQIKNFYRAWVGACERAGVKGHGGRFKFHDLRRTATRNMRRAGVPREVAKRITGHKTDSMFQRYNIVDGDDLEAAKVAMRKVEVPSTPTV